VRISLEEFFRAIEDDARARLLVIRNRIAKRDKRTADAALMWALEHDGEARALADTLSHATRSQYEIRAGARSASEKKMPIPHHYLLHGVVSPETIVANATPANFTKTLAARKQYRLSANVDIWYRLDGTAAVNGATSAVLKAGSTADLVFDGANATVNIVADSTAGRATLQEVIAVP
jgi:hypothetical protein